MKSKAVRRTRRSPHGPSAKGGHRSIEIKRREATPQGGHRRYKKEISDTINILNMQIKFKPSIAKQDKLLVAPLFLIKKKLFLKPIPVKFAKIAEKLFKSKEFECKTEQIYKIDDGSQKILLLGLGKKEKLSSSRVRNSFAVAFKKSAALKSKTIAVLFYKELEKFSQEAGEGMILASYNLAKYKTGKALEEAKKSEIEEIIFITKNEKLCGAAIKKGVAIADTVNKIKDLVNAPSNVLTPAEFATRAKHLAKEHNYKIEILEKSTLKKLGLNTLLAVNAGADRSEQEARMIILKHLPLKNAAPIVIVGKGIIFDTGGYNIKTNKSIYEMQHDKAGACAVLGVFELLTRLKIKQNVIGIMPITENLVGPRAYKPADIIKTYSGKTVEVVDTDAEGRLILADAISYAVKNFKPRYLIDIATLTGACVIALGDRYAGAMGNDKKLLAFLRASGRQTDELIWPLPMHPDFQKKTKSKIADIQNIDEGTGYMAGASKGAA
ncbi:leucyl aminopeptidase, partial [Candidatus Peregrinibacteria bacterium]|nr:leucyl aminopeptidase [Candidatus Peregrinibacteria bacterium]